MEIKDIADAVAMRLSRKISVVSRNRLGFKKYEWILTPDEIFNTIHFFVPTLGYAKIFETYCYFIEHKKHFLRKYRRNRKIRIR